MSKLLAVILLAVLSASAWSTPRTVTLSVPTMDCPVCPITIRKALAQVAGVSKAEVNFDKRQAVVSFDDAKVSVEALTRATADAGYPSTLADGVK